MPVLPDIASVRQHLDARIGPEADRADQHNAVILLGSTAMLMATGSERYIGHNRRMFDIASRHGIGTEVMSSYIGMHDLIEGLYSEDEVEQASTRDFLTVYGNGLDIDSKRRYVNALGYATGGHHLEAEIAEAWRTPTLDAIDELTDVEESDRTLIKQSIAKELPSDMTDAQVVHLEQLLKNTRLMDLDIELLSSIVDRHDVESVLGKSIELIDNLDKPNRPDRNPASTWRDAIEALTCWGPICDLYGYFELGAELRGKAYEFFYEDNAAAVRRAETQHALSEKHLILASEVAVTALQDSYRGSGDMPVYTRTKSIGSIEQKLVEDPDYAHTEKLSDGIGIRVVVPDGEFTSSNISDFADRVETFLKRLVPEHFTDGITDFSIKLWHPTGDENAREDRVETGGPDDYHAYHMTFMMHVNGEDVPFEIQFFGESQNINYIWGPQSHPVYKANRYGERRTRRRQQLEREQLNQHLQSFRARAEDLMNNPESPSLNPNSWFDILRLLPDLETPLHEIYGINDHGIMMPKILLGTPAAEVAVDGASNVILPPLQLNREQAYFILDLLDPNLSSNDRLQDDMDFVSKRHADLKRKNSVTTDFEGHILPTAVYAAIAATISGQRWQDEDFDLFTLFEKALLHDTLEDTFPDTIEGRSFGTAYMRSRIGSKTTKTVIALTLPLKKIGETEEDKRQRRADAVDKARSDKDARRIKPADREQNVMRDVANLMRPDIMLNRQDVTAAILQWTEKYKAKTDDHMGPLFAEPSNAYFRMTKDVIWLMLDESLRYQHERLDLVASDD